MGADLVELEDGDDIFFVDFFVEAFEAKDLEALVVTTFAFLLHLQKEKYYSSINLINRLKKKLKSSN